MGGILLSNHGSRQLDRTPVPFHSPPHVIREVGKNTAVMVDIDIMNDMDIAASIALGVDLAFIGRTYLYGFMMDGHVGVNWTITILHDELVRAMKLLGIFSIAELEPYRITQFTRYVPAPKLAQHATESAG